MAGKKDNQRFLFFKYVPPKKGEQPLVEEEYSKTTGSETSTEWFGPPGCPDEPECPEVPEGPVEPEYPESPEFPELPECPELPELPECPELPEVPECPEIPEGPCPENATMHVIQAGDTFWKLAKQYGTTVEAITAANPDVDPLNLQIGETICIPLGIPGAKG
ncbi:MAG: LysM peptidoglycan-binding domain-containing protein [Eubacteriales bacterium]